ncbi:hypothetical protein NGH74_08510 [Staphylococcus pseudoxylosus]|uniref:hypothetical protein n=1 Tax=Staphylococcus pseudoxylosus TaxID=2282419 RepID=UPI002DBC82C9|nr:hypothetical protein [Staphylococcus pseudoxylosus]MEB8087215.1 hypothetical protein [Staphylococcus pseudoxylosus]
MAYEYEEFIDAMRFGLTMSDRDSTDDIWKMVDEVVNKARAFDEIMKGELGAYYDKAQAFDEVKTFVTKKLDEDVRHYHCFKSERDNGELVAYERIDDIIREHMERADDES